MSWSYKVFRAFGIDVRVHITFVLFLVVLMLSSALEGNIVRALFSALFVCLVFGTVILHELGHCLAALRYGVPVKDITLLPIGGVAQLGYFPRRPLHELVIAIAGPAVNLSLALLVVILIGPAAALDSLFTTTLSLEKPLSVFLGINVWLMLFNLIPAFPMDGGRVLRALLAMRMSYRQATRIAARLGQLLCVGFFVYGCVKVQPMLCFIAVFIFFGAGAELLAVEMAYAYRSAAGVDDSMPAGWPTTNAEGIPLHSNPNPLLPAGPEELPFRDLRYRYDELRAKGEQVTPVYSRGRIVAVIRDIES